MNKQPKPSTPPAERASNALDLGNFMKETSERVEAVRAELGYNPDMARAVQEDLFMKTKNQGVKVEITDEMVRKAFEDRVNAGKRIPYR